MAADATTIARPYAVAAFDRAVATDKLDLWSDMLGLLAAIVRDPGLAGLIASPTLDRAQMGELLLEIGGGRLSDEGQNLVKLLAANQRLGFLPEIASMFEARKAEYQNTIDVHVTSAYPLDAAQSQQLEAALKQRLGRDVRISSERDPELIGGFRLRAGDMVIDGSVAAQLEKLANELGI